MMVGVFPWNGRDEAVVDLSRQFFDYPIRPLSVPEHLVAGALEVLRGEYEPTPPPVAPAFHLNPGDQILDIGANVGAFATWASHRFPGALVASYEPNPEAVRFLKHNVEALEGVTVHPVGVRHEQGAAALHEGGLNLGEASFHLDAGIGAKNDAGVVCAFVDAATLPDASIVKVDTEGCEVEILERYLATREHVPVLVMFEFHRVRDRLVLEELLELRGLYLVRGRILSPNRGTLIFARIAAPARALASDESARLAKKYEPRVAAFVR